MNGDSLAKASSRHSMVCEAKIYKNPLKIKKKQEIKSFVGGKNTNNLEMQCCKIIGEGVCVLG